MCDCAHPQSDNEHIRLLEARCLLDACAGLARDALLTDQAALIIAGDFNASPSGPVYAVMVPKIGLPGEPEHHLSSAYAQYTTHGEPEYTTWKVR